MKFSNGFLPRLIGLRSFSLPNRRYTSNAMFNVHKTYGSLDQRITSLHSSAFINYKCFSTRSHSLSNSDGHEEETFEQFTQRFETEFNRVNDVFDLQRTLNNAFAYDLVPSVSVCEAALRAARRVNDFPTAVRIFEGIRAKVETEAQYSDYLQSLDSLRKELGVPLREELYPTSAESTAFHA